MHWRAFLFARVCLCVQEQFLFVLIEAISELWHCKNWIEFKYKMHLIHRIVKIFTWTVFTGP